MIFLGGFKRYFLIIFLELQVKYTHMSKYIYSVFFRVVQKDWLQKWCSWDRKSVSLRLQLNLLDSKQMKTVQLKRRHKANNNKEISPHEQI